MAVCPYNASHHVPKDDERSHLMECRDRRIVEMQKYNEPLPGRHGCLSNPPFYGSALIRPQQIPVVRQQQQEPEEESRVRLDDTVSSISTIDRHRDLKNFLDTHPRQSRSPQRRRPSISDISDSFSKLDTSEILSGLVTPPVQPLRRPILTERYRTPPPSSPITTYPRSRRTSPSESLNTTADGTLFYEGIGTSSRKTSPSPVGRRIPYPPTNRGVPRRRSNSPSGSSAYQSYR